MEKVHFFSYLSPKLQLQPCPEKGGFGLFAIDAIKEGELLTMWGGRVVTGSQLEELPVDTQTHGIQVDEDLYMVPVIHGDPSDYFNHCCDPNAGMSSHASLVAMRDVAKGEEICFDYAMSDSSDYDEFECQCGAHNCRKRITGRDWMLPELHVRYNGFFSPYLQRRIEKLLSEQKKNGKTHHAEEASSALEVEAENRSLS